ncbi:MAG: hypothetical protein OEX12_08915 [Gammaproteobacteria bacterium]|nr:hypothetical protein [Gammaproteobacteria bacterium]
MAQIGGIEPGYKPKPVKTTKPKKKKSVADLQKTCSACGYTSPITSGRKVLMFEDDYDPNTYHCKGCVKYFNLDGLYGSPDRQCDAVSINDTMSKFEVGSYALILVTQQFTSNTTGRSLKIEMGDALCISRVGFAGDGDGTWKGSQTKFSIDVHVGTEILTLFPHEVSPISWITIMSLKSDGEYMEAYLEEVDGYGVWQPTLEVREQIINAFGPR